LLITALAVCLVAPCAHALEAGATKIELVPPDDVPLDGLTLRAGRRATGIHDPLYVRALYLEEDGVAIFLVSLDLFAVSDALRQRILELTPPSVREDHVLVTATHTLRGPGGLNRSWLGRQRAGRFMPGWMESVAQAASEAMRSAYDTRVRGSMGYATGEQTGMTLNPTAPELPHDSQLGVIRVDDSDGNPIAVLANTAGAEPAPGESTLYTLSAGYPGAFCTAFEGMSPGNVVAFFLNGHRTVDGDEPLGGGVRASCEIDRERD